MPVWIISGVAGSGKSSLGRALAAALNAAFLDADDFHPPANKQKMAAGLALDEADRELWLQALEQALGARRGQELVLAFPGLKALHRRRIQAAAGDALWAWLRVDLATVERRLAQRGGFFPPSLAASQFEALEPMAGALELDATLEPQALAEKALLWARRGSCAVVGLGRMGLGLALRLVQGGFEVLGWDEDAAARQRAAQTGLKVAASLAELFEQPAPRRILLSLPAGAATEAALQSLQDGLNPGDLLIDAGNARHGDSQARAAALEKRGIHFVDAGVSGGLYGAAHGYCVMAGGGVSAFLQAEPLLAAVAGPQALLHVGPAGQGHLVKTVHNGIEYGLMQAYAEGFELLQSAGKGRLDLAAIARLWGRGAVVRSWLLELAADELAEDPALTRYDGRVGENSTGRWSAELAQAEGVPVPALQAALEARSASRSSPSFGSRLLSGLRHRFGGHGEALS